ncbi:MAG: LamG-like jellyroll fold domain-containing protein, partial [Verrucomicrobiota bacterium]
GLAMQGYIRDNNGHNASSLHWSGLLISTQAHQALSVTTVRESSANGTSAVIDNGRMSILIERIEAAGVFFSRGVEVSTNSTDWNPTAPGAEVEWENDDIIDTVYFSHDPATNAEEILVIEDGDYLLIYNDALTAAADRPNPLVSIRLNGTAIPGASTRTHFIRNLDGHNESSGSLVFYMNGLSAGDRISVHVTQDFVSGSVTAVDDALLVLQRKSFDTEILFSSVTNILPTGADLGVDVDISGAAYDLTLFWGPNDGGTTATSWVNRADIGWVTNAVTNLSYTVTGLQTGSTVYFAWRATNCMAETWSSSPRSFETMDTPEVSVGSVSDIVFDGARVGANLDNGGPADLFVFFGDSDGGSDRAAWDDVVSLGEVADGGYDTLVTGLTVCTPEFYRVYATNLVGEAWSSNAVSFVVGTNIPEVSATSLAYDVAADLSTTVNASNSFGHLWVYYGDSDGGTNPAAWTSSARVGAYSNNQSVLTHTLSGLTAETTVFYTYAFSNCYGTIWQESSDSLDTISYSNRMAITFQGYDRAETLTNFPVLVQLSPTISGFDYASFSSPTGGDLRFFDHTETEVLNFEIELWDTNGVSHVWVQAPELADTCSHIYARWGSPVTNLPVFTTNGATWSESYVGVWHLGDDGGSGVHADSASSNDAAEVSDPMTETNGRIGEAQRFDGDSDELVVANESNFDMIDALSMSVWFTVDSLDTTWQALVVKGESQNWRLHRRQNDSTINWHAGPNNISSSSPIDDGQWHHVAPTAPRPILVPSALA